jgi:hypothetical protein
MPLAEEFACYFGSSSGAGHHGKMPLALQNVHFGTANGAAQDVRVVRPHEGIVFAGEDQRALAQTEQPQQAGPADQGGELVVIGSRVVSMPFPTPKRSNVCIEFREPSCLRSLVLLLLPSNHPGR